MAENVPNGQNVPNGPNQAMVNGLAEHLARDHRFWAAEYKIVVGTLHYAKKRNLPAFYDLFVGKLHMYEIYMKACKLALGEMVRYVNKKRFDIEADCGLMLYNEMEDVSERLMDDPRVQRMERRYQRLCRYEDETLFFVARIKASLENGEEVGNDSFVVIEAVEDATVELSLRLREAEILEKCMSRTHRHIQRSMTAIKMFTGLIEEKVRDLTEDQIRQIPIANVNIFEGGFLRIVNVRHRDGEAILQDGFADIPERPPESSSSEEE